MRSTITGGSVLIGDRIVPDTTVAIEDGRISLVGNAVGRSTGVDARGLLVLPGIVDLHADAIERAIEPRPGVRIPLPVALAEHDAGLIASGVTTCFVSLTDGFEPGLRSRDSVQAVAEALADPARPRRARTPLHIRREVCAGGDPAVLTEWMARGRISLLSINDHLPSGDDPRQEQRFLASLGRRIGGGQAQLAGIVAEARARRAGGQATAEELCRTATALRIPVASHDDASPEQAAASVARGVRICEFPADLATASRARSLGAGVLMGAPNVVRGSSHVGWVSAADAIAAGCCDMLCSDYHHPCLFMAPFELERRRVCSLATAWNLVSRNPAAAAGLADQGRIATGQRADILLVDPDGPRIRSVLVDGREVLRQP